MASAIPDTGGPSSVPALKRADRLTIWGGLAALSALAWIYLALMPMKGMAGMAMAAAPMVHQWSIGELWLTFLMWAVMMVAMMLPSSAPMLTTYLRVAQARSCHARLDVWLFGAGYVVAWTLFSAVATVLQVAMDQAAAFTGAMRVAPILGGVILALAGAYQLSPLKHSCLRKCQSPLGFLMTHWREGSGGAITMGLRHGVFCVGCCWMLMVLLFVAGVMNLLWVAALTAFVLIERATRWGNVLATASGFILIASGLALAALG